MDPNASIQPFEPDRQYLVHVSGGRTSAFMLRCLLDQFGGLPDNARAVFCNTGKERSETLLFLREIERRWGCPITWLEYRYRPDSAGGLRDQKNWFEVVSFDTASRNGEPFEALIRSRKMLPNVVTRFCTSELKVDTALRWARVTLGWRSRRTRRDLIGIRYDEPRRYMKAVHEECRTAYPLVDLGATLEDVMAFWSEQPFDLGIESRQGNCDLCFLKGKAKLKHLIREEPERAAWWIEQERYRTAVRVQKRPDAERFIMRFTYSDLVREVESELPFDDDPADDRSISCFCGD